MAKRVFAWILLLGFVFLILNISLIGFYRYQSFAVYMVILVIYFFYKRKSL